jgi:hypothetical protein
MDCRPEARRSDGTDAVIFAFGIVAPRPRIATPSGDLWKEEDRDEDWSGEEEWEDDEWDDEDEWDEDDEWDDEDEWDEEDEEWDDEWEIPF